MLAYFQNFTQATECDFDGEKRSLGLCNDHSNEGLLILLSVGMCTRVRISSMAGFRCSKVWIRRRLRRTPQPNLSKSFLFLLLFTFLRIF